MGWLDDAETELQADTGAARIEVNILGVTLNFADGRKVLITSRAANTWQNSRLVGAPPSTPDSPWLGLCVVLFQRRTGQRRGVIGLSDKPEIASTQLSPCHPQQRHCVVGARCNHGAVANIRRISQHGTKIRKDCVVKLYQV